MSDEMRLSHDPVTDSQLNQEQWFADLIGGMLHRSEYPPNIYRHDRMINIYGEKQVKNLIEVYDTLRGDRE